MDRIEIMPFEGIFKLQMWPIVLELQKTLICN